MVSCSFTFYSVTCLLYQIVDDVGAVHAGMFADPNLRALQDLLTDIATALVRGRSSRRMSPTTTDFYVTLLQHGGMMIHDWVSQIFFGPNRRTTLRHKAAFDYPYILGISTQFFNVVIDLMTKWGLHDAPFIISEDGTALQMRIDITTHNKEVYVFGLGPCSFKVTSEREFWYTAQKRPLSSTLYVFTIVPLIKGAPKFPLFAFCHDNTKDTFDFELVEKIWCYIWQVKHNSLTIQYHHALLQGLRSWQFHVRYLAYIKS